MTERSEHAGGAAPSDRSRPPAGERAARGLRDRCSPLAERVRRPAGLRRGHPRADRPARGAAAVGAAHPQQRGRRRGDPGGRPRRRRGQRCRACPASRSAWPGRTSTLTLVEPMARRVEFLEEVVAELAVPAGLRWRVVRGRAEERSVATAVGPVDVVTARAVAPLPRLVGWCRGLMRPGTQLVALVGASALAELPVPGARTGGRGDAGHPSAGCRCGPRGRCHYRGGHDARSTVTAPLPTAVRRCSTWNRYSHPTRST